MSRLSKHALGLLAALAVAAMVFAGCQQPAGKDGGKSEKANKQGPNIVEFDGGALTVDEFKAIIEQMKKQVPPQQQSQLDNPQNLKNMLSMLSEKMVLAHKAEQSGITDDLGVQGLMELSKNEALAYAYIYDVVMPEIEKREIPEEDLKSFYDKNTRLYDESQVQASHILVETQEEAMDIYEKVKKNPELFAEMAKKHSKDASNAPNGGDLGWFGRGRMVPAFENAAFSLEKGRISEPVETQFGWHIIRVENKSETGLRPFDEVKPDIKAKLLEQNKREYLQQTVIEIKDKANIKILEENIPLLLGQEPAPAAAEEEPQPIPVPQGNTPPPPPPTPEPVEK